MDVLLKEGALFLQGVKFGKRVWRKIWTRVFQPSEAGIGRIEMYDVQEGAGMLAKLKKADKRVIRLADCLSVTPALGESCPAECAAFYLNTAQRIYTLAAPTQDEWVPALCSLAFQCNEGARGEARRAQGDGVHVDVAMTENNIYSSLSPGQFQVTVVSSEASVRCCMSGSYLLSPEKESVCLLDMKTGQVEFCWPYRFLRRFGQVKEGVTIEAGRRCQTGEGLFIFLSKQGQQIHRAIEEAIMHQRVQDLLSEAAAQDSTEQKSSLPSPQMGVAQRNLPLPALPGRTPRPLTSQTDVYAMTKPLPKPRNVPSPPSDSPEPKLVETKPKGLDVVDTEPYESGDWNQNAQSKRDTSGHHLYSKIKTSPHARRKPDDKTGRENPECSRRSSKVGNLELPVSFKEILSDVLFKDKTRSVPSSKPSSYSESADPVTDPVYYEIQ